ncbi:MAG: hypothetical protein V3W34_11645 [Phycisphaerae bacterium]
MARARDIRQGFRRVNQLLGEVVKQAPAANDTVGTLIQQLASLEQLVEESTIDQKVASPRTLPRGKAKEYRVERTGKREVVAEYRPDDLRPFRCPRSTYDAVARALAKSSGPVAYDQIVSDVAQSLGTARADYQIRVALRFLTDPDVGLVERNRARYRVLRSRSFLKQARDAWERHLPDTTENA